MNSNRKFLLAGVLILLLLLLAQNVQRARVSGIRLVLLISADQFPQEYLHRFKPVLKGGLKRLLNQGASFQNAYFDHANTATCPGHATMVTGSHPARHGIIGNSWFDRSSKNEMYCVADAKYDRSPRNILVDGIGDWLKDTYDDAKVFSASGKDRAAIALGGQSAEAAYWYDKDSGEFTTSGYYAKQNPSWLRSFNSQKLLDTLFGSSWTPLAVSDELLKAMKIMDLDEGDFPKRFPHVVGNLSTAPNKAFYGDLYRTPFLDSYLVQFAKRLISEEKLGQDHIPDFLGLSFSALDTVGHGFGPNSREVLDTLRRLDAGLDELFDFVDEEVGMENVLVVFSSDHGIQAYPEAARVSGREGERFRAEDVACVQKIYNKLKDTYGFPVLLRGGLSLDEKLLKRHSIKKSVLEKRMVQWLEQCSFVEKVWLPSDLQNSPDRASTDSMHALYRNNFLLGRSSDFVVQPKENHLDCIHTGTNHGSPYTYDRHVPLVFMHQRIPAQQIESRISMIDVAPTISSLLGIDAPDTIDGRDRADAVLHR